jgi:hypothetical protein
MLARVASQLQCRALVSLIHLSPFLVGWPAPTPLPPSTQIRSGQAGLIGLCFYRVFTKGQELTAKEVDADVCALFVMHANPTLKLCVDLDVVARELRFRALHLQSNNRIECCLKKKTRQNARLQKWLL